MKYISKKVAAYGQFVLVLFVSRFLPLCGFPNNLRGEMLKVYLCIMRKY